MNLLNTKIESDRLLLVPTNMSHAEDIFREFTPEITTYMTPPSSTDISLTKAWIKSVQPELEAGTNLQLSILDANTKEFLGCVGLHKLDDIPRMGIWIKKNAHGHGYGKEAVTLVYNWAVNHLDFEYITYPVAIENVASRRIPESLGGTVAREYIEKKYNGTPMQAVEYHIPKKQ